MKRKNAEDPIVTPKDDVVRVSWRRIGGGSSRLVIDGKKRIIKPGEVFQATEEEVPEKVRDVIIRTDGTTYEKPVAGVPKPAIPGKVTEYTVAPRGKSKTLFDVVSAEGKKVNDKPMQKEVAEQLVKDLMA